jgi:hypothetical protein
MDDLTFSLYSNHCIFSAIMSDLVYTGLSLSAPSIKIGLSFNTSLECEHNYSYYSPPFFASLCVTAVAVSLDCETLCSRRTSLNLGLAFEINMAASSRHDSDVVYNRHPSFHNTDNAYILPNE